MGKKKDLLDKAKINSAMIKLLALVVFLSGNSLVYGAGYIAIVVVMIARKSNNTSHKTKQIETIKNNYSR
jgi:hypothetical protein